MTLDIESIRRDLIAMRVKLGALTTKGRTCSKLIGQLENLEGATGQRRVNLIKLITASMSDLNKQ